MKTCSKDGCDNPQFGGQFCKHHQYLRTDKKKPSNTLLVSNTIHDKGKTKTKLRKPNTGELELFKSIWSKRKHVSELSGVNIPIFDINCFHHLLTKQAYPEHRLVEENIVILTRLEHRAAHDYSWQQLIDKDHRWQPIYERYLAMKQYGQQESQQ